MIIFGINRERHKKWHSSKQFGRNNGAYWYARDIEANILPKIESTGVIVTAGASIYSSRDIPEGSIIVCHDNRTTKSSYGHLFNHNMLWVASKHSTVETLQSYGERAVYIPLSIDAAYVAQYKTRKTKGTAFVGNAWGFKSEYLKSLPPDVAKLSEMERDELLQEMAKYKHVIAEGRCLMEAQVLGCKTEVPVYKDKESVYVEALDNAETIDDWSRLFKSEYSDKCIIIVIRTFTDLKAKRLRKGGEIYIEDNARANDLISKGLVKKYGLQ